MPNTELVTYPEVRYVGVSVGRYDLIVEGFFAEHDHMQRFLTADLGRLEGVKDVETSLILEVAKSATSGAFPTRPATPESGFPHDGRHASQRLIRTLEADPPVG